MWFPSSAAGFVIGNMYPPVVRVVKYVAAVSVTVTFLMVALYIGPSRHDMAAALFCGNNRSFHFLIPLLAIADQVVFDREGIQQCTDSLMAAAPTVVYGIFCRVNIAVNGAGKGRIQTIGTAF